MKALLLFLCLAGFVNASTKYYAQSSAGTNDGSSAANAYSAAQFNAASPYSPAGDDVLILNSNITTPLAVPTSGTNGHPITIQFASGASMSKGNWFQSGVNNDSAIYATGKNFITIDGGTNGLIEATSNGTNRATQLFSYGITTSDCSNWIIKNLTIQNMYVRVQGADTVYGGTGSINVVDTGAGALSNLTIDNCVMSDAGQLVALNYTNYSTVEINNCTLTACAIGVNVGSNNAGATMNGLLIHDNSISEGLNWSGQGSIHKNCIHAYGDASHTGTHLNGLKIYNNTFGGELGDNATSYCFLEGFVYSPLVYCNLFVCPSSSFSGGNGFMVVKGTQNCVVGNNTFIGVSNAGTAIGTTGAGVLGTGLVIKNNVLTTCGNQIFDAIPATSASDYNVFYLGDATGFNTAVSSGQRSLASWQALLSFDTNSVTTNPNLNGSYFPVATSSAISTGTDMSAYYTTDKAGVPWATGTGWGRGALKASGTGSTGGSSISGKISISGKVIIK